MSEFHRGQRWISNTESELGLGFVEKIEGRHITFVFPAADETRVYAASNAPLSRVKYPIDERISSKAGLRLTVTEHLEHNGCIVYRGLTETGEETHLHELELDSFAQFSKPQDRLFAGQIDKEGYFQLRVETLSHLRRQQGRETYGLLGARVQILPHQFYIAYQVGLRHAPRVLLADEVGLGKTIEAGLILHQQLITERVKRVLIVVPESLIHQWLVEMLRRFNLHFSILDEERCTVIEEAEESNPFESAQLVLCSLSFLSENSARHQQAIDSEWDLMIVDEAHHLIWSETVVSDEYQCIESLAKRTSGLLLLTATPEQLGVESHFARLRLLDPNRFYDLKQFQTEQEHYAPVNALVEALLDDPTKAQSDAGLLTELESYLGEEVVSEFEHAEDADQHVEHLIQSLLDRHGTGRVLFRNTRDAVAGFPTRVLNAYPLPLPTEYRFDNDLKAIDAILGVSEEEDLGFDPDPELDLFDILDQQLHPESLHTAQDEWLEFDPRVTWLADWLDDHWHEKVLLICAYVETALALEYFVRLKTSSRAAVFHENLSIIERDRAAAYFADPEEGANLLICSEIGSEGRNFQFAHHLVLFDLPLNPDLLEQRIGRLDRIGQTETIQLHVPHFETGAQARLTQWYHEGLNAFRHVCSVGHRLFDQLQGELIEGLISDHNVASDHQFETLIEETKTLRKDAIAQMQQGRDRLLELNSCHKVQAKEIVQTVQASQNISALAHYMERVFDHSGVDQQSQSSHCVIIKPTEHMMNAHFPGLSEDGMMATFRRATALSREDVHFLTWEHPMVVGAMDMVSNGEFGNATFCSIRLSQPSSLVIAAGTLVLEAIFSVQCPAPKHLQLHRYLSINSVRIVIASNGMNLSEALSYDQMNKLSKRVRKKTANDIIQYARPQITQLVEQAQVLAKPQQITLIEDALTRLNSEEHDDLERLRALAAVNPNIRQEEIEQLEQNVKGLKKHLSKAQLRLDAIRLAFVAE
ncbi:MAG: RNA polymerase-associated protein RapA [Cocleimonas sp.]|nr:RNA polymerase-associated protein RapA [Cocleimonas sp.]